MKKLLYRNFDLDQKALNEEKNELEMSFSTERPVKRWYMGGIVDEVLLHGKTNVDLSYLKAAGSLIYNHSPDVLKNVLGPVKRVWITSDRILRTVVGFDEDPDAQLAKSKVKSGSLRGASFAYQIHKVQKVMDGEKWTDPGSGVEYKGPIVLATKWMPFEITLTPIPADHTVGPNKNDLTKSLEGIEIEQSTKQTEVKEMEEKEVKQLIADAIKGFDIPKTDDIVKAVRAGLVEDAKPKFNVSGEEFKDLTSRAGAISPECKLTVTDMVGDGKKADEIKNYILDEATKPDAKDKHGRTILDDKNKDNQTDGPISSFKQIEDDDFFGGIGNPTAYALN